MSADDPLSILLVDDDDDLRDAVATGLRLANHRVVEAKNGQQALAALDDGRIGAIVSDIRMPMLDGRQLLNRVQTIDADLPVILITGHADIDQAVDAVRNGAFDFLAKPFASDRLANAVAKALDRRRLVLENRQLRAEIGEAQEKRQLPLLGPSPAVQNLVHAIRQIGSADIDVLVEGERGAGKVAVAHMLHSANDGRKGAIQLFDCEAVPASAVEEALFGGGRGNRPFRPTGPVLPLGSSDGGTVIIGNVDHLPLSAQARLLHVLQTRDDTLHQSMAGSRVRIISTCAHSLSAMVETGGFRADLYYRLAPIRLDVPPLRARRQDIPLLFVHLMRASAERFQRDVPIMSDAILARLANHDWPGNLRELQNFADTVILNVDRLDRSLTAPEAGLADRVSQFESDAIRAALAQDAGDIQKVCARLSIPRKTLYDKIKKHAIDIRSFRTRPST